MVKFRAGGLVFNANVAESSETRSPQTGDMLRSLVIQFRAQKIEMHEQALQEAELRQSGGVFSLGESDEPELEWRVRDFSSQYVGNEPYGIHHHVWRIEQLERLACERLILGSISLEPYDYVEDASDDGRVRLVARALVDDHQLGQLSRVVEPVDVVRVGISDTPRRMRVTYVWGGGSRLNAQAIAVMCEDVGEPRVTIKGYVGVSEDISPLRALLKLLRTKGVLDDADLDTLVQSRHAARRVADVDAWPLADE